jgi:hypothetical protein
VPTTEMSIWLALKGRVQTLTLSPAVAVVYPKENAPEGKHIRVRHLPNENQRPFMGSTDPVWRRGILQLSIMSPISAKEASDVDMQIAGKIAEHFAQDTPMRHGGLSVKVERAPDIAQAFRDGEHWHTPVSVRWYCFA